jgi:hypothetical protein
MRYENKIHLDVALQMTAAAVSTMFPYTQTHYLPCRTGDIMSLLNYRQLYNQEKLLFNQRLLTLMFLCSYYHQSNQFRTNIFHHSTQHTVSRSNWWMFCMTLCLCSLVHALLFKWCLLRVVCTGHVVCLTAWEKRNKHSKRHIRIPTLRSNSLITNDTFP